MPLPKLNITSAEMFSAEAPVGSRSCWKNNKEKSKKRDS